MADEVLLAGLPAQEDRQGDGLSIDDIGSIGDALADSQDGYAPMYRADTPACCCCCG